MAFIALLRHGERVGASAEEEPIRTRSPSGLSAAGRDQAHAAAEFLATFDAPEIVCSDAVRAIETAEIIAGQRPVRVVPELAGMRLGAWERRPIAELPALGALFADPNARPPGGESLLDLLARVRPALQVALGGGDHDAIVVGHRMVNAVLLADMMGVPLGCAGTIQQDPGAVNILDSRGGTLQVAMVNVNPLDPLRRGIGAPSLL